MGLSIVITYFNEGQPFIEACIDDITTTIGNIEHEIIVVDDCSNNELKLEDVTVIRHKENKGVGAGFDTGVKHCKYEDIVLMACDIRIKQKNWGQLLKQEIEKRSTSIICVGCIGKGTIRYGANIIEKHWWLTNPSKPSGYRDILQAEWKPEQEGKDYLVPCVLGAFYGLRKQWYEHIDGFWGHIKWGGLEPYISLKSWLFGGDCTLIKDLKVEHIFNRKTSGARNTLTKYNKMLIAYLLIEEPLLSELIDFMGGSANVKEAKQMLENKMDIILEKKKEYNEKKILNYTELLKEWNND